MRCTINRGVIGPWAELDISKEEYNALARAQTFVTTALSLERKFDMLLGNYLEYEQEILTSTLRYMVSFSERNPDAQGTINRRLANVLTVARLYIDHVKHDVSTLYGKPSSAAERITRSFSEQYDRLVGYRLLEAVRNYMQHKALAVGRILYSAERKDDSRLRYRTTAHLNFPSLIADPEFKASLQSEMKACADQEPDLTPWVREYVEGLSRVHTEIRSVMKENLDASTSLIRETVRGYALSIQEETVYATAWRIDDDDLIEDSVELVLETLDRLHRLYDRDIPTHLSQAYVSDLK